MSISITSFLLAPNFSLVLARFQVLIYLQSSPVYILHKNKGTKQIYDTECLKWLFPLSFSIKQLLISQIFIGIKVTYFSFITFFNNAFCSKTLFHLNLMWYLHKIILPDFHIEGLLKNFVFKKLHLFVAFLHEAIISPMRIKQKWFQCEILLSNLHRVLLTRIITCKPEIGTNWNFGNWHLYKNIFWFMW